MKFTDSKRWKRFLAVGLTVALIVTVFSIVAAAQTRASQKNNHSYHSLDNSDSAKRVRDLKNG